MAEAGKIVIVTGMMASGKSSVAQGLAERLHPSVHLRGDGFRRMIVNGRADMAARPPAGATEQLMLRYRAACDVARMYHGAGFNVVYQDVIIGPALRRVVDLLDGLPLCLAVLCPTRAVIEQREAGRAKSAYGAFTIDQLHAVFEQTPRIGLWVDNSAQSVEATVDHILAGLDRARI